jgi:hypothetical protein
MLRELRYYCLFAWFRLREPFTDFKATGVLYILYCFFIWILSHVWLKYNVSTENFNYKTVFLYVGVTEMLFMSFLITRNITSGSEDFALFLARPRSWLGREIAANIGQALGRRLLFAASLVVFSFILGVHPISYPAFLVRIFALLLLLALPQALISALFSSLRLSYPQTDYFILPFGKLFLALGGVFGPLSDYGQPWREIFLQLPGSDLFFQPAYFAVHGHFFMTDASHWLMRLGIIQLVLFLLLFSFYRRGRHLYQAWGG